MKKLRIYRRWSYILILNARKQDGRFRSPLACFRELYLWIDEFSTLKRSCKSYYWRRDYVCTSNSAKCVFLLELFETEYITQKSLTHPSFYNTFKSIKEIKWLAYFCSSPCTVFIKSLCLLLQARPASDHPANIKTIKSKARDFIVKAKIS